jgi:hypothetical protein
MSIHVPDKLDTCDLEEFKNLYQKYSGKTLTDAEAQVKAHKFLSLLASLIECSPYYRKKDSGRNDNSKV